MMQCCSKDASYRSTRTYVPCSKYFSTQLHSMQGDIGVLSAFGLRTQRRDGCLAYLSGHAWQFAASGCMRLQAMFLRTSQIAWQMLQQLRKTSRSLWNFRLVFLKQLGLYLMTCMLSVLHGLQPGLDWNTLLPGHRFLPVWCHM